MSHSCTAPLAIPTNSHSPTRLKHREMAPSGWPCLADSRGSFRAARIGSACPEAPCAWGWAGAGVCYGAEREVSQRAKRRDEVQAAGLEGREEAGGGRQCRGRGGLEALQGRALERSRGEAGQGPRGPVAERRPRTCRWQRSAGALQLPESSRGGLRISLFAPSVGRQIGMRRKRARRVKEGVEGR